MVLTNVSGIDAPYGFKGSENYTGNPVGWLHS